jgi:LysM repeat protein
MSSMNVRRVGVVAWPFVVGALLLAACGSDDGAAPSQSTVELNNGSTAFVVKEPATTVPPEGVTEEGTSTTSQEYVVQSGDYPLGVAQTFGITVDELVNFNEWSSVDEFPYPGETIKIPPGASAPTTVQEDDSDTADNATVSTEAEEAGDTIPEAGDNCAEGSYTIEDGDYPIGVAEKFDVTVDALNAANAGTPGYSAFYPGLDIVIPAKSDC